MLDVAVYLLYNLLINQYFLMILRKGWCRSMLENRALAEKYPHMDRYTSPIKRPEREIVGRKEEMRKIRAAMLRPELCNVILLGEAGAGKTMLVQGTMMADKNRSYMEVDLSRMISDCQTDVNEMATKLKSLFDETGDFVKSQSIECVLFIDEFHQVVQLSAAAVEALKPLLADSGTRGIRVIAATTYVEFRKFIAPNQPLVERLQRINITQPDKAMVVNILKGMAKRYGVDNQFRNDRIFELIYEYTNRYIPANSQPRKSLLIMDAMIGWHRAEGRPLDHRLLADVIYESEGVNTTFRVDATTVKQRLDSRVYAQGLATSMIEQRLQICVADLNNKTKPMSSFLFTGSTGTGKMLSDDTIIPVFTDRGHVNHKRNGDIKIGDFVFNREGRPVRVQGVFPQGQKRIYEFELADGRVIECGAGHLWSYRSRCGNGRNTWRVATTIDLMKKLANRRVGSTPYVIPMNGAVQYPDRDYVLPPYVMGATLAAGVCEGGDVRLASKDGVLFEKCSDMLADNMIRLDKNDGELWFVDTYGLTENDLSVIPEVYKYGSVAQRWSLVQGLFDATGYINGKDRYRYHLSCDVKTETLAKDIQNVLFSLGIQSSVTERVNGRYQVYVACANSDKKRFFTLERKLVVAERAAEADQYKARVKKFDTVGIREIRETNRFTSMTCISVEDEEQLYQAGQYVVTHNTEMTKALAEILFSDDRNLIRFDMTEYANEDSLERFRHELTARIWERPYSIVLLDEIEKACAPVTRILLQVLDDGRLMDENNREVTFTNCYMVLTTNAGSEIYKTISQYGADDDGSGKVMKHYDKLIRASIASTTGNNRFPPELLGRIDCIVPFQPLSEETMKKIVKSKLLKLKDEVMRKHNIKLRIDPIIIRYLVEDNLDTDSDSGGARKVMSKLEADVTTAVARYINRHPGVAGIDVTIDGKLAADDIYKLESEAYVVVRQSNS